MRLIMTGKQGLRLGNIGPFGKAFSPPGVIFLGGMKLGKKKCQQFDVYFAGFSGLAALFLHEVLLVQILIPRRLA